MGVWKYESVGVWEYGSMEVWGSQMNAKKEDFRCQKAKKIVNELLIAIQRLEAWRREA